MTLINKKTSINELADIELLSTRSVNICRIAGLIDLEKVFRYYQKHLSFKQIRNCGEHSEKELTDICKKYDYVFSSSNASAPAVGILDMLEGLSAGKNLLFRKHFEFLRTTLSTRTSNGLKIIFDFDYNNIRYINDFLDGSFKYKTLENIGNKSFSELESLRRELSVFLTFIYSADELFLSREYLKIVVKRDFQELSDEFESRLDDFLDSSKKIRLLKLVNFIVEQGRVFSDVELKIFRSTYNIMVDQAYSLQDIANEVNLTRERVRQIKLTMESRISNVLAFIHNFNLYDLAIYGLAPGTDFNVIDDLLVSTINTQESCSFNIRFYGFLYQYLFSRTHYLIDKDRNTIDKKPDKNSYRCMFLISKKLWAMYDFDKFLEDIYDKVNEKNIEDYSLNFKGYLFSFFKEYDKEILDDIASICQEILFKELDILVGTDGYFTVERNVKKPIHVYYVEILEEFGNMMTVNQIAEIVNQRFPSFDVTSTSVRAILNREKSIFIYFGRSSTYGLRKWEDENDSIRGGTIRDLVEEYLFESKLPQHISHIVDYVNKYRDTNEKSVRSNLKLDEKKRFAFFKKGFIGLQSQSYPNYFESFEMVKNWNDRFAMLSDFVKVENRFPSSSAKDKLEKALSVFLYRNKKKFQQGELLQERESLLRHIGYPLNANSNKKSWSETFEMLITFHRDHNRFPRAGAKMKDERYLYQFVAENKRKFKQNKLNDDQLQQLLHINLI